MLVFVTALFIWWRLRRNRSLQNSAERNLIRGDIEYSPDVISLDVLNRGSNDDIELCSPSLQRGNDNSDHLDDSNTIPKVLPRVLLLSFSDSEDGEHDVDGEEEVEGEESKEESKVEEEGVDKDDERKDGEDEEEEEKEEDDDEEEDRPLRR